MPGHGQPGHDRQRHRRPAAAAAAAAVRAAAWRARGGAHGSDAPQPAGTAEPKLAQFPRRVSAAGTGRRTVRGDDRAPPARHRRSRAPRRPRPAVPTASVCPRRSVSGTGAKVSIMNPAAMARPASASTGASARTASRAPRRGSRRPRPRSAQKRACSWTAKSTARPSTTGSAATVAGVSPRPSGELKPAVSEHGAEREHQRAQAGRAAQQAQQRERHSRQGHGRQQQPARASPRRATAAATSGRAADARASMSSSTFASRARASSAPSQVAHRARRSARLAAERTITAWLASGNSHRKRRLGSVDGPSTSASTNWRLARPGIPT